MFDRFTDRARKVMNLAKQAAQELGSDSIGSEHILIGIVDEGNGVAANVLRRKNVDLQRIRAALESGARRDRHTIRTGNIPFTPAAKKVLENALMEVGRLGHDHLGTEHLLLGLLADADSVAARLFRQLGVALDDVRREVIEFVGGPEVREQLSQAFGFGPAVPTGRIALVIALDRAIPEAAAAALSPDQRERAAHLLLQRLMVELESWPRERVRWREGFALSSDAQGNLTDDQARELIAQHLVAPEVTVGAACPLASNREIGPTLLTQRRTFPLARRGSPWIEEVSIDGVTVRAPIDVQIAWTTPLARLAR